ncbi:MAG: hypothetical protein IJ094_08475 [Bacilli bacterium]|nr:hypothetical protein [Bacilli bacterium]
MKKIKYVALILVLILLCACGKKVALNENSLDSKLTDLGFNIVDVTKQLEDESITTVKTANNGKYQIEYYIFKSSKASKNAYKNNVKSLKANKDYKGKETNKDNYDKYVQETNDFYNSVTRVDNTIIYVSVGKVNKSDVKKVISKLGY